MIGGIQKPAVEGEDEEFMLRALELAELGRGTASPNPMVGAVVLSGGSVIGEGYHAMAGEPHAEVIALEEAGVRSQGSTMYVSLEPCVHHGRTPPCTERIISSGVARVVVAMKDPNPRVMGKGIEALEEAGVTTASGVLEEAASRLNEAYVKWITHGVPFVVLKSAVSLDGRIATRTGNSRWITCEESRRDVHSLRAEYDAVMVGIGTVLADNPELTSRMVSAPGGQPLRVVVDSHASTPLDSKVAETSKAPTLVAVTSSVSRDHIKKLEGTGIEVVIAGEGPRVDLHLLLRELGERAVTSVLVEGGSELAGSLVEARLADKMITFIAPVVIGGRSATGPIGGSGVDKVSESMKMRIDSVSISGSDLKVVSYPGTEQTCLQG